MKRRVRGIITITTVGVALVGSSVAGWAIGSGRLGGARDQIENRIATYRNVLLTVRSEREERPELDRRLADVLDRSLGSELESVDSDLRRRLSLSRRLSWTTRPFCTPMPPTLPGLAPGSISVRCLPISSVAVAMVVLGTSLSFFLCFMRVCTHMREERASLVHPLHLRHLSRCLLRR